MALFGENMVIMFARLSLATAWNFVEGFTKTLLMFGTKIVSKEQLEAGIVVMKPRRCSKSFFAHMKSLNEIKTALKTRKILKAVVSLKRIMPLKTAREPIEREGYEYERSWPKELQEINGIQFWHKLI
jgi:hypothetical protein